VESNLVPFTVY